MKFYKHTAENGDFTLMLKLRVNSMFLHNINVENTILSRINIKSDIHRKCSAYLFKKACDFELKCRFKSFKYLSIK